MLKDMKQFNSMEVFVHDLTHLLVKYRVVVGQECLVTLVAVYQLRTERFSRGCHYRLLLSNWNYMEH